MNSKTVTKTFARLMLVAAFCFATPAFAFQKAGMRTCSPANQPLGQQDSAVILKQATNSKEIQIIVLDHGRTESLGSLPAKDIASLRPKLRYWAAGGLTTVYVGTAVVSAGAYGFAYLASFFGGAADTALTLKGIGILAGGQLAIGAGLNLLKPLNPVSQFKRGNVEWCLSTQSAKIASGGESIVIRMNNASDLRKTRADLLDLISDLK